MIAVSLAALAPDRADSAAHVVPSRMVLNARAQRLDQLLRRLVPFGFSGSVAVIHRGDVLLERGYGSRDTTPDHPIDIHTAFDIGSMSKTFTAAVMLKLVAAGKLSIDDSLASFYPNAPADKRGITLRQLLSHAAGLPAFHDTSGDFEVMTRDTAVARILGSSAEAARGTFSYSNSGYSLLAAIAEHVTGQPFASLLNDSVLAPSGMRHTGLYADARWGDEQHLARGVKEREDMGSPMTWAPGKELWALVGNGGVVAPVEDLIAWDRALRGHALFGDSTLAAWMQSQAEVSPGVGYALGWYVVDDTSRGRSFGHTGANDFGFASAYEHFTVPDLTLILLTNRQPQADINISVGRDAVLATMERTMFGDPVELPPATRSLAAREIESLEGTWWLDDGSAVVAEPRAGALKLTSIGPRASELFSGLDVRGLATADTITARAGRVVDGAIRGDWAPLAGMLEDPKALDEIQQFVTKRLDGLRAHGSIRGYSIPSVTPAWWSADRRFATVIRIQSDTDSTTFRFHWDDGRIFQFGGGAIHHGPAMIATHDRAGALVGYDVLTGVRVTIVPVSTGSATRLRIDPRGANALAVRRNP